MSYIDSHKLRQVSFIAIVLLLGYVLLRELKAFIPAFLGAVTLYVIMRKWMIRMLLRKMRGSLAAALLMLTSFIIIMLPVWLIVNLASSRIGYVIAHSQEIIERLKGVTAIVEKRTGFQLVGANGLEKLSNFLTTYIPTVLGATFNTVASLAMLYFMLYFMLTNGRNMEKTLADIVPMNDENTRKVGRELNNLVISNAVGIPLIALLQGAVGFIGYLLIGVKDPVFWFVVTCITSMLPVVGAAIAYVPLAIIFLAQNDYLRGVLMLGYGFGIIGLVDNVFRIMLQRKMGDVHPLITILGVIAGVNLFGFIGLIFGPILISLFILLIKIYSFEFARKPVNEQLEK